MGMISDLYNGEISPFENMGYSNNEEYKTLTDEIEQIEKLLFTKLSKDEIDLCTGLIAARTARENMELERTFIDGFKLAALLMIDVYSDNE